MMFYSPEGNSSRAVAVRLLHSTSGGGRLTGSLYMNSQKGKFSHILIQYQGQIKKKQIKDNMVPLSKEPYLGGKLLPGSLPSRGLASSLLGTSHLH